jgi:CRP-like cAMP-binding protein
VRHAIGKGDARARAAALEYLDNTLTGLLRKKVISLFEDRPRDLKADTSPGRTDGRRIEEAVVRIINDRDPVLSATAVSFVWEQRLSNLVDELERVLANRSAQDWCVFEAASWVFAAFRIPEVRRRDLWLEPLPVIGAVDRLRQLPLFGAVEIEKFFRIAAAGRQVRHESGRLLEQETLVPESVHFLLDGRVVCSAPGKEMRNVEAPAALGFIELLEGKPLRETVRADGAAVTMTLSRDEFRTLLSENTELVQGLFKSLCGDPGRAGQLVMKGIPSDTHFASLSLKPIEKALIFQGIPIFSGLSADGTLALSSIAIETSLAAGSVLFGEGEPPALLALVSGEICLESPAGPPVHAMPSDAIGIQETLAGIPFDCRARVLREGLALRIDREDLFDLLAHRPEILQEFFGALFRRPAARQQAATA